MLIQRISKACLAIVISVQVAQARQLLSESMASFDRTLIELRAFAPNPAVRSVFAQLARAQYLNTHATHPSARLLDGTMLQNLRSLDRARCHARRNFGTGRLPGGWPPTREECHVSCALLGG